jgi:uncharacterized protein YkwD
MIRSVLGRASTRGLTLLTAAAAAAAVALRPAPGPLAADALADPADTGDLAGQVLQLTNQQRQAAQLAPLAVEPALGQAAQQYANVLALGACFAHTCGPVPDVSDRTEQAGYLDWVALGENIAAGQPNPTAVVDAWMQSPEHRANILGARYTDIGTGVVITNDRYQRYWVQEFGAR